MLVVKIKPTQKGFMIKIYRERKLLVAREVISSEPAAVYEKVAILLKCYS